MRSLGMDSNGCKSAILESGLASNVPTPKSVTAKLKKDDLLELADCSGLTVRKSWAKSRIADLLIENNPETLIKEGAKFGICEISHDQEEDVRSWIRYTDSLIPGFTLLCFSRA
jgi:hypothetical protein